MHVDKPSDLLLAIHLAAIKPPEAQLLIDLVHRGDLFIPLLGGRSIIGTIKNHISRIPLVRVPSCSSRSASPSGISGVGPAPSPSSLAHATGQPKDGIATTTAATSFRHVERMRWLVPGVTRLAFLERSVRKVEMMGERSRC